MATELPRYQPAGEDVPEGAVVGLLGHNGAGKTTTVRLLAGLLPADEGAVRVGGRDPIDDGPQVRAGLGVLPATLVVDDRLTATHNLRFVADVYGLPRDGLGERIEAALARFEREDRAGERVSGFSTGMRQRLSLARVLLPDPEILLLDEPTAALDPVAARQVRRALAELAQGHRRTIVPCTHDLAEAEVLCDRVVVLEHGRIVADGSPAELAAGHGTGGVQLDVAAGDVAAVRACLARVATGDVVVNWRGMRAVVRRDLTVVLGSKAVVLPALLVPAILLVLLPAAAGLAPQLVGGQAGGGELVGMLPEGATDRLSPDRALAAAEILIIWLFSSMILMVPVMYSAVIAAGAIVYAAVGNLSVGLQSGRLLPTVEFTVMALWVGPTLAAAALGAVLLEVAAGDRLRAHPGPQVAMGGGACAHAP